MVNTLWLLLLALLALAVVAAAIGFLARRARRQRHSALAVRGEPPQDPPGADWQDVTQRYRNSRIEALRGWMGEDHELVQNAKLDSRFDSASGSSQPVDIDLPLGDEAARPCAPAAGHRNLRQKLDGAARHLLHTEPRTRLADIPMDLRHERLL